MKLVAARAASLIVALVLVPGPVRAQAGDSPVRAVYEEHNKAAASARTAGDWATVRRHAAAVDTLFNGNPSTLMVIARASARMGHTADAMEIIRCVLSMGIVRNLKDDKDLESLHALPEWPAIAARNDSNAASVGTLKAEFALPSIDLLAEDIVWDGARDRYLVSSVRRGEIFAVGRNGRSAPLATKDASSTWGMFALAVDSARSTLWATTVAMPHFEKLSPSDTGKSAIIRYDLASGAMQKRYDLRPTGRGNAPGDIALGSNGDLYVSDSRSGIIYVIRRSVDSLEVFVPEGTFMSPQGPSVSPDGRSLYVADYIRGIARVDLASRSVTWLKHARDMALSGIDGLMFVEQNQLVAVQNGVWPNRLMSITLTDDGGSVASASVLAQDTAAIREPTHGLVRGDAFLFIANSGWDGFGEDGTPLKEGRLTPPAILSLTLRPRR